ncbi:MAG: hypothetical protein LKE29_05260 [Acidaminococcaceae bacterium]|nr:hypothetical protein [Acidaminococcaceae bacterium]
MKDLLAIVDAVNGVLWDKDVLLLLLVGTGIWYSFQLRFIQVRGFAGRFERNIWWAFR